MKEIGVQIISVIVSAIVLPLISVVGTFLIKFIKSKVKSSEMDRALTEATNIVGNAVRTVAQTYVDELKNQGKFDKSSQATAFNKAKEIVLEQMKNETKEYLTRNYGSLETWVGNQIESCINKIKTK